MYGEDMTLDIKPVLKELQKIPGIGPILSEDLYLLGVRRVSDLKGKDPQTMFDELNSLTGRKLDRCVLYVFRCAVYFATEREHRPELLKWWNWKDAVPIN